MHAWILGVGAAALVVMASTARGDEVAGAAQCPRSHAAVLERFISAECEACWTDAAVARPAAGEWLLDWIVPSARGDEAPLSSAAPPEAVARARRALGAVPAVDRASVQRSAARAASSLQLRVTTGPAWNGYFAVQVATRGAAAGTSVWVALVEAVGSGTDGSAAPRQLVRTLSGPFTPPELRSGKPWQHLVAMRWPETAKPVRLQARAWIEDSAGRIFAMAGSACATQ